VVVVVVYECLWPEFGWSVGCMSFMALSWSFASVAHIYFEFMHVTMLPEHGRSRLSSLSSNNIGSVLWPLGIHFTVIQMNSVRFGLAV
jgi:hypothetical protein